MQLPSLSGLRVFQDFKRRCRVGFLYLVWLFFALSVVFTPKYLDGHLFFVYEFHAYALLGEVISFDRESSHRCVQSNSRAQVSKSVQTDRTCWWSCVRLKSGVRSNSCKQKVRESVPTMARVIRNVANCQSMPEHPISGRGAEAVLISSGVYNRRRLPHRTVHRPQKWVSCF